MKRALGVLALVAAGGGVAGLMLDRAAPVHAPHAAPEPRKVVLFDGACPPGCAWTEVRGDSCACATRAGQARRTPDEWRTDLYVCERKGKRWISRSRKGGRCLLIAEGILDVRVTHGDTMDPTTSALQSVCCADCDPGACWITPQSWGHAPHCLLDGNCADHCLTGGVE